MSAICSVENPFFCIISGKVIWFNIAPGLLYSLTMDQSADEEALLRMAGQIYSPVQGG